VVPDSVYKKLPTSNTERPTHFFQPDSYFDDPNQFRLIPRVYVEAAARFGKGFVNKNGTAPWRARQMYDLALESLRSGDYKLALEYAGVMSHYVGDMSQPLHDTKNYDGEETNQKGIHAFFESTNLKPAQAQAITDSVVQVAKALLQDPKFRRDFTGSINNVAFNEVNRAYALKDVLLAIDKKQGRTGSGASHLLKLAIARMGDGAATLALILNHLWADAGNPSGGAAIDVDVPEWVRPDYDNQGSFSSEDVLDDCLL